MVKLYPGVAQLVARMVRVHEAPPHSPQPNRIRQSSEPQRFQSFFVSVFRSLGGFF